MNKNHLTRQLLKEPYPRNLWLQMTHSPCFTLPVSEEPDVLWLKQVIPTLSEREQQLIRLRFEERMRLVDVGVCMGVSPEGARYLTYIVLRKLRRIYQKRD